MANCFVKECGVALDDYVIVKDPNQNINVIQVDKKNEKVYFRQGWLRLRVLQNRAGCLDLPDICVSESTPYGYNKQERG
jgi:hypothetical protein